MAIQMRRGNLVNYDEDKMLPGEFAVATDEKELYIAFGTGDSKKILTEDDAVTQTVQNIWTGKCETSSNTAGKTVTLDDPTGFDLTDGTVIMIDFQQGNNATHPTLNVENTGAKEIVYQTGSISGSPIYAIAPYYEFGIGVKAFVYKSTVTVAGSNGYWVMMGPDFAPIRYLMDNKAGLNSPQFTGTPKSTTPATNDNSIRIATTAFVRNAISTYSPEKTITATDQGDGVVQLSLT